MHDCCLSFILICPLIAYFLKKNYSLRQNIFEKYEGLREVTHISPNWCLFGSYLSWDLIGNRQHEQLWRFAEKGVTRRWNSVFPVSDQKELHRPVDHEDVKARWPDSEVQRPVSSQEVNSYREGVTGRWNSVFPASGRARRHQGKVIGL